MTWVRRLHALIRNLFRRSAVDRDLDEELASYLELAEDEARAAGLPSSEARRQARLQLGGTVAVTEAVWSSRAGAGLERIWRDVWISARRLRARPSFTLTAVAMLGLAVGTTTAMFTVVDAFLFRPLPFRDADRIAAVWMRGPTGGRTSVQPEVLAAWRASTVFEAAEGALSEQVVLDAGSAPLVRSGAFVSIGLLQMLGVRPLSGRLFDLSEGRSGTDDRVLISENLWRGPFNADPGTVGRRITLNRNSFVVIGILPRNFRFPEWDTQVWRPIDFDAQPPGPRKLPRAFVKFAKGVPDADALRVAADLAHAADPTTAALWAERDDLRHDYFGTEYVRTAVPLLGGGIALVFVVLCANVGGLLLSRFTARRREFSMCTALGASRARLLVQASIEGVLLGAMGAAAGIGLAVGLVGAAARLLPTDFLSHSLNPLDVDVRALGVAAVLAVVATLVAGWVPAWFGTIAAPLRNTTGRTATDSRGARVLTHGLLVGQIALACALLVAATLLARSFIGLSHVDLGFDPAGKVGLWVATGATIGRDQGARWAAVDRAATELARLPGVRQVVRSRGVPLMAASGKHWYDVQGDAGSVPVTAQFESYDVPPGWFTTFGLRLLRGRDFRAGGDSNSIILASRLASTLWPSADPIGRVISWGNDQRYRVVGVVNDTTSPVKDLEAEYSEVYFPLAASAVPSTLTLLCGACPAEGLIRQRLLTGAPGIDVWDLENLEDRYREELAPPRAMAGLGLVFGTLAVVVAASGLFSVLNQAVGRRRREFGIRIVLGSSPGAVRQLVLRDGIATALAGVALGSVLGWLGTRWLSALLYGVTGTDPLTWGLVVLTLVVATLAGSWQPARQAMRVDPGALLREE